ncbi:hypothetical protein AMTR_s00140p00114130 [Amborella trichopoda]|uniref:Uncharacterized protein n=1 Tax=Amborella trichopoda TaxID=13333 RepID=W1PA60_AMBTC|nr:hypothetical protein AMTR_s00140p00114130 [Amborella trichopoda]
MEGLDYARTQFDRGLARNKQGEIFSNVINCKEGAKGKLKRLQVVSESSEAFSKARVFGAGLWAKRRLKNLAFPSIVMAFRPH